MDKNFVISNLKTPWNETVINQWLERLNTYGADSYLVFDCNITSSLKVSQMIYLLEELREFIKSDFKPINLKASLHEITVERLENLFEALNVKNNPKNKFLNIYAYKSPQFGYAISGRIKKYLEVQRYLGLIKKYKVVDEVDSPLLSPLTVNAHQSLEMALSSMEENKTNMIYNKVGNASHGPYNKVIHCYPEHLNSYDEKECVWQFKINSLNLVKDSIDKPGATPFDYFFDNWQVPSKFNTLTIKEAVELEKEIIITHTISHAGDLGLYQNYGDYKLFFFEAPVGGVLGLLDFIFLVFEKHLLETTQLQKKEIYELFCFKVSRKLGIRYRTLDKQIENTLFDRPDFSFHYKLGELIIEGRRFKIKNTYFCETLNRLLEIKRKSNKWIPFKNFNGEGSWYKGDKTSIHHLTRGKLVEINSPEISKEMDLRDLWNKLVETKKVGRENHVRIRDFITLQEPVNSQVA